VPLAGLPQLHQRVNVPVQDIAVAKAGRAGFGNLVVFGDPLLIDRALALALGAVDPAVGRVIRQAAFLAGLHAVAGGAAGCVVGGAAHDCTAWARRASAVRPRLAASSAIATQNRWKATCCV